MICSLVVHIDQRNITIFIAQYLGHADVETAARHIHYSDDDLEKGAEDLAELPSNFTPLKVVSS